MLKPASIPGRARSAGEAVLGIRSTEPAASAAERLAEAKRRLEGGTVRSGSHEHRADCTAGLNTWPGALAPSDAVGQISCSALHATVASRRSAPE